MSIVAKMLKTAERMARRGASADLGRRLDEGLAPLRALTGWAETGGTEGGAAPFACLGRPATFDAGLAEMLRRSRPAPAPDAPDGSPMQTRTYAGPAGTRSYRLFVPESEAPPRGLVLMLHGCTQTAEDFATGTGMNALAAEAGVAVAYPAQPRSANPSLCWNWFDPHHQGRDRGEPAILAGLAQAVATDLGVPRTRVFVAGLSAGAAMAAVLAETHADLFAAVGLHSGLAFGAARDVASAFAAMRGGAAAAPAGAGRPVPTILFQGDADQTVHPANADAILARLVASEPGLRRDVQRGTAPGGRAYTRTVGRDAAGAVRFEDWRLAGGTHAWSGGNPAGSYTDPAGPNASAEMLRFFLARG